MRQKLSRGCSRSLGLVRLIRRPQQWQSDKLGRSRVLFSGGGVAVVEEEEAEFGGAVDLGFGSIMRSFLEGDGVGEGAMLRIFSQDFD